jgi:hypothetical protein
MMSSAVGDFIHALLVKAARRSEAGSPRRWRGARAVRVEHFVWRGKGPRPNATFRGARRNAAMRGIAS